MTYNNVATELGFCSYEYLHVVLAGQLWGSLPQRLKLVANKCELKTTAGGGACGPNGHQRQGKSSMSVHTSTNRGNDGSSASLIPTPTAERNSSKSRRRTFGSKHSNRC